MPCTVRPATTEDLEAIAEITNQAILTSHAHFGTEPVTVRSLEHAWRAAQGTYPWLVADDTNVSGFAKAGAWKPRGAYRWTTEIGVYVRDDARGKGIGRALYERLFEDLRHAGFRTALAGVALPNAASERLHRGMGMRRVGVLPDVGFKLGAWRDVAYYAIALDDSMAAPAERPNLSKSTPPPHQ